MGNVYGYVRVSSIEQNEDRQMIALKRLEQGISAAKKRGVRFARPKSKVPNDFKNIVKAWEWTLL